MPAYYIRKLEAKLAEADLRREGVPRPPDRQRATTPLAHPSPSAGSTAGNTICTAVNVLGIRVQYRSPWRSRLGPHGVRRPQVLEHRVAGQAQFPGNGSG